ncbi:type II CRISPR RNA-guided endonuclease Cas9 [Plebeiibacterium marinum]|uniref:CRISPR-associated endonuclease Cas9 n=1 Tax=Plebeiibacterium marinum TaxID=2992111 RepID=A0AAE3MEB5_9BACT|nr:type II CRISPR RNA-guided endonuclease Cas9 [Plebeiobacterium marinum]MCW3805949.1 type II CRISPR RNA-guided endonuclease Cas9 [Plebeiobacterium marinum]
MSKILGLDLGTNSIGWAVVETEDNKTFTPIDKGVRIFQEGVKIEKGVEGSKAAERTGYRSARRIKFRRKLRKIETLKVLVEFKLCPQLTKEELDGWRYNKVYPQSKAFKKWWLTDNEGNTEKRKSQSKNPYFFRNLVATEKLDLSKEEYRFVLGRAFYHIAQRRGFLSNRLEGTKESDGAVKQGIEEISQAKGDKTLGQYFYELYINGEKIRNHYTHREAHYLEEFNAICELQELPTEQIEAIKRAIFFQRPLKSQKGLIGKCPFETNKPRCAVSHPLFEEYRMLCFVNNIKIKTPDDEKLRFLNNEEKEKVTPAFFRKSKEHFDFEDIAKQLAPPRQYKYFKSSEKTQQDWLFNYSMKTTVSGCPVSARFKSVFGEDWQSLSVEHVRGKDNSTSVIDINDVWHVLMTFDSDDKLTEFATKKLKLREEQTKEFVNIHLKQDFASLSLKAIKKILPYLRQGLIYSHAVFLANMEEVIPMEIWSQKENQAVIKNAIHEIIQTQNEEKQIIDIVNGLVKRSKENNAVWSDEAVKYYKDDLLVQLKSYFGDNRYNSFNETRKNNIEKHAFELFSKQMQKNNGVGDFARVQRIDERIKQFLEDNFDVAVNKDNLYHPSAIETFKPAIRADDGNMYLGSPMTTSVRNPMAMRALHQLRKVVNELIHIGAIDESTVVHIEMSRGLMNANERKAYQNWQRKREDARKKYTNDIKKHFEEHGIKAEPTETEILKYQLWEEQNHICIYTGENICLSDFLGSNPKFDIEHTIPQSVSFDNSQVNKTLCSSQFNRAVKRNKIPSELPDHDVVLERIEYWKTKYESIDKQIAQAVRNAKGAVTKDAKDNAIRKRHELTFDRDYWRAKYQSFTRKDVPIGFKNSQLVDIGIISKYSRLYLQTLFNKVFTVKGSTVADFRRFWGLQETYETKARVSHTHHCIDAMIIACMTKAQYDKLAKFYHDWEDLREEGIEKKPLFDKPWPTFTEDVKNIENELFVSHYTPDNLPKSNKKKLRKRGKIQYDEKGNPIIKTGDSVRGSLHKETFYGAIEREEINKKTGEKQKAIKYVVRKKVVDLSTKEIDQIVDTTVREKIRSAKAQEKELLKDIDVLRKKRQNAGEQEEKSVDLEIAAIKRQVSELYCMPNSKGLFIPIKKVRLLQPTITKPLTIKKQRDVKNDESRKYKRNFYAANDGNYFMAIYEGTDAKGKIIRDFKTVDNFEVAKRLRKKEQDILKEQGINPLECMSEQYSTKRGVKLKKIAEVKTGMMVIFWENTPMEIEELLKDDPQRVGIRLYKLVKFDKSGRLYFRHHKEARRASDLKEVYVIDWEKPCEQVVVASSKIKAWYEGFDFEITPLGKIQKL